MINQASTVGRMIDRVYSAFGESATYTDRNGATAPCVVVVERDLTKYGEVAQVNVRTAVVHVRLAEVANPPRRGETFTLGQTGQVLTVESQQALDQFEHRVFVA